jgi:hypothetical protein
LQVKYFLFQIQRGVSSWEHQATWTLSRFTTWPETWTEGLASSTEYCQTKWRSTSFNDLDALTWPLFVKIGVGCRMWNWRAFKRNCSIQVSGKNFLSLIMPVKKKGSNLSYANCILTLFVGLSCASSWILFCSFCWIPIWC